MKRFDPYENTSGPLDNYQDSLELNNDPLSNYSDPLQRVDPFADNPGLFNEIINWSHDPMNKPQNQNKYFFSDGKTYYEQICKMLKLMAVFKDAFNQIYDNEDEIHEAWENFVENLSATATAGDEASVTLTWTDESVQFEFVMPRGQKGDKGDQGDPGQDGVSISNITFNADYTMTITLSNGNTYTSPSLKGEKGDTGEGLEILDIYATLAELEQVHPTGQPGDAYLIGTDPNYTLYIWSTSQNDWLPAGSLTAPSPSTSTPLMDGTASTGSENAYSRGDHVHPTDTSRASASDLTALSGTVTTLSDDLTTLSGNVTTLSGTVTSLSSDVSQLQSDMLEAQGDISDLETDMSAVSGDVTQLQADVTALDGQLDTLSDDLSDLEEIVTGSNDLDDQQFLYREAPTDHDTIARINSIKGNTVSFNQLSQLNSFTTKTVYDVVLTNNNDGSITFNGTSTSSGSFDTHQFFDVITGHKYYLKFTSGFRVYSDINSPSGYSESSIIEGVGGRKIASFRTNADVTYNNVKGYLMVFDLTLMGIDNLTTAAEVEAWLSSHIGDLPYYDYTQGTLIPFMGTGLKTTGKNLLYINTSAILTMRCSIIEQDNGEYIVNTTGADAYFGNVVASGSSWTQNVGELIDVSGFDYVCFSSGNPFFARNFITRYGQDKKSKGYEEKTQSSFVVDVSNDTYISVRIGNVNSVSGQSYVLKPQIELGSTATDFEPYTSNTLSLPTLTYFPTGMKSAGIVYDELTQSKATTRTNKIVFDGTQDVSSSNFSVDQCRIFVLVSNCKPFNSVSDIDTEITSSYLLPTSNQATNNGSAGIHRRANGSSQICISLGADGYASGITTKELFNSYLSNHPLTVVYPLDTITETSISPELDLTYPIWNGGTEQILPVNGSTPTTAPIRADFTYMSTDEAIQYLYDHISASVQAELDDLDDRVTDTETAISSMQTDISDLQTDLSTLYVIQEHDYGFGNFSPGQNIPYSGPSQSVTGYTAVGIIGSKIYRLVSGVSYYANGMVLDYAFCDPLSHNVIYNIMNVTSETIENVRLTLYVLYIKDNGGN